MAWTGSAGSKVFARLTGLYNGATAWAQTEAAARGITSGDHDTHDQDLSDGINSCLMKDGGNKPTANIDWGAFKITNLGLAANSTDAASKAYVDSAVAGIVNTTVRVATTANITISTALNNADTLDGVTLATSDRVLVKDQTLPAENGIYIVGVVPARATDFDTWAEHVSSIANITAGTTNAGRSYRCTVNAGGTLNTTDITYVQFGTTLATPISLANGGTGAITAAAAFTAVKQDATSSATGVVELATASELRTGTDTGRVAPVSIQWDALAEVTISFGSTITPDLATGINFGTTATTNFTLANPSNPKVGQTGVIRVIQDGTGGRSISAFGSNYVGAPTLLPAANAVTYLHYRVLTATKIELTAEVGTILFVIDGGGSAITTGIKGDIGPFDFDVYFAGVTLLADQSGSIVLDLWADTYANYPPTVADTITASAKPTLSSTTKSQNLTLTGWTTTLAAGKVLRVNVDSASTVTRVTMALKYSR